MRATGELMDATTKTAPPRQIESPGSNPCPSLEELRAYGREQALLIAKERRGKEQKEIEATIQRAGIPRRFRGKSFDGYETFSEASKLALAVCRGYADYDAEVIRDGRNLILTGRPGTGKTHLACAILSAVISKGRTGLFITVSEALRFVRDSYSPRAARSELEAFALLTAPALLALDEVGVGIGDAEKRRAMLFDILNTRYAEQRPTILIGNLTVAEMRNYLGERIMDRMTETGSAVIPFAWGSYRTERNHV